MTPIIVTLSFVVNVQNGSRQNISKFLKENRQDLTLLKSDNCIAGRQDLNVVVRGEATRGNRQDWADSQKEAWHRRQSGEQGLSPLLLQAVDCKTI